MAERSVTRTAAQIATDLSDRASANELSKKQNEVWFNKFLKDMPELDDELNKYSVCIYSIKDVCKKTELYGSPDHLASTKWQIGNQWLNKRKHAYNA